MCSQRCVVFFFIWSYNEKEKKKGKQNETNKRGEITGWRGEGKGKRRGDYILV